MPLWQGSFQPFIDRARISWRSPRIPCKSTPISVPPADTKHRLVPVDTCPTTVAKCPSLKLTLLSAAPQRSASPSMRSEERRAFLRRDAVTCPETSARAMRPNEAVTRRRGEMPHRSRTGILSPSRPSAPPSLAVAAKSRMPAVAPRAVMQQAPAAAPNRPALRTSSPRSSPVKSPA